MNRDGSRRKLIIFTEHKDDVILIAETLLEKETITAEEIEYLLKNRSLPTEEPKPGAPLTVAPAAEGESK